MHKQFIGTARRAIRTIKPFMGHTFAEPKGILRAELDHHAAAFYENLIVLNRHHPNRLKLRINSELKLIPGKLDQLSRRATKVHRGLWREAEKYDARAGINPHAHAKSVNQYVRIVGQEMALAARLRFFQLVKLNNFKLEETFRILEAHKGNFDVAEKFLRRVHGK